MSSVDIKRIACIGSGVIGSSWATNFAMKGYPVNLYDIDEKALARAKERIELNLNNMVELEAISQETADNAKKSVTYTMSLEEALKDVQFIQESLPEHYEVKQETLKIIDQYAPEALYASSTSGLLITEIAKYSEYAHRCVGAHPYNPPHLIPLVELTKGEKTDEGTVEAVKNFYQSINKEPVVLQKELLGFISNRLQAALYREVMEIVSRGVCTIEDVDKACLYGPGLRYGILGPNLIWQLGGGDVGLSGLLKHVQDSMESWWDDMSVEKRFSEDWFEKCQAGVEEEMRKRPKEFGNTNEEIEKFRDKALVELLKIHKKL